MSIVRIGLAETKDFADGYDAIFGKKAAAPEQKKPETEAKAEARRRSRQARQAQAAIAAAHAPQDVLLFDGRGRFEGVGAVLEAFGFVVHRVSSSASAMALIVRTPLVAAFIDAEAEDPGDPEGPDGLELCQQIKHRLGRLAGIHSRHADGAAGVGGGRPLVAGLWPGTAGHRPARWGGPLHPGGR